MHRATRMAIAHFDERIVARLGVSTMQLGTLSHLAKNPGTSMTDVAALFDLNKSAVSGMITRLERSGFVRREPNPHDGRGALLFLTKKGERAQAGSRPAFRRAMTELTDGFTEHELDVVIRFLNAVIEKSSGGSRK
jgi:DNA-binding MarR family transcriptional regulator